ncbi:AAA family ATPase CDC6 [Nakaseomyces bracarensis]|uniref:AAA family ATPase CDC6 n=1 Tax=Nakaseomyces bracarensis TaxID=273131 RepID=UPI00387121DF
MNRVLQPRNIPVTPTKKDADVSGLKKRKLFDVETPSKRRQLQLPSPESSPVRVSDTVAQSLSLTSRTKATLQRSATVEIQKSGCLVSRDVQYTAIMEFLRSSLSSGVSNSLYITGPPGTGKTAQLNSILKKNFSVASDCGDISNVHLFQLPTGEVEKVAIISINCITVNDPASIFNKIYISFLSPDASSNNHRYSVKSMLDLKNFMQKYSDEMSFVVILDEMDKLVQTNSTSVSATKVIFELFLLAKLPDIKLMLISIANSLDLKDRFLSRLNLRQDLLPETIVFQPYTSEQMYDIVSHRINSVILPHEENIFNPMAIRFAAKKCSGNTGDLRKLLDILRNSIEVFEMEQLTQSKKIKTDENDQILEPEKRAPKVGLQHVAKVFTKINNINSTRSMITKLNMQQRIVLCSLIHRQKVDIFQAQCTIDEAYDYYIKLLGRSENFVALRRNEFLEICNALEMMGVATIFNGRVSGKRRPISKFIKGTVDQNEFNQEMSKFELLKDLMIN